MQKILEIGAKAKFYYDVLNTNRRSVCIDCGANVGKYSNLMALKGATVYAFEPNPWAFKKLKDLSSPSVIPLQKCVSTSNQNSKLYLHSNHHLDKLLHSTGSSLESEKWNVDVSNYLSCESVDIVHFITLLAKPIDILKIDIEGHEVKLLQHLVRHPAACAFIKSCYVELHHKKFEKFAADTDELIAYFKTHSPFPVNFNWH